MRDRHTLDIDYTYYCHPHLKYARIEKKVMTMDDKHRVEDCKIGVTDLTIVQYI